MTKEQPTTHDPDPSSPADAGTVEQLRDRVITQAFVAGQMDAQLKHADELTRPALRLLQAKTYTMAQESIDALIAAAEARGAARGQQEMARLRAAVAELAQESNRNEQLTTLERGDDQTRVAFMRGEQSMARQVLLLCERAALKGETP